MLRSFDPKGPVPKNFSLFFLFFLLCLFFIRYFFGYFSFPGQSWDYGSHIAIAESLGRMEFFPEWFAAQKSEHTISRFMPIYHGLWGSHLLLLIGKALGMPMTSVMLLALDASLLVTVSYFFRMAIVAKYTAYQLVLFMAAVFFSLIVLFYTHARLGMFSQIVSTGFLFGSLIFSDLGKSRWATAFLGYSLFCYPANAIWAMPFLGFCLFNKFEKSKLRFLIPVGTIIACFGVISVLYSRINLTGLIEYFPLQLGFSAISLLLLMDSRNKALFFRSSQRPEIWGALGLLLSAMLLAVSGSLFKYYGQKIIFGLPLLVLAGIGLLKNPRYSIFFSFLLALSVGLETRLCRLAIESFLKPDSQFSYRRESELRDAMIKLSCSRMLVFDKFHYSSDVSPVVLASNSIGSTLDLVSSQIFSDVFEKGKVPVSMFIDQFSRGERIQHFVDRFHEKTGITGNSDCLAVDLDFNLDFNLEIKASLLLRKNYYHFFQ